MSDSSLTFCTFPNPTMETPRHQDARYFRLVPGAIYSRQLRHCCGSRKFPQKRALFYRCATSPRRKSSQRPCCNRRRIGRQCHLRMHRRQTCNSPPFNEQLAIDSYWKSVGGMKFLPGTHRASDRFARISWNLDATPKVDSPECAIATVFSLIRHISVPLGIVDPEKPNLSSTLWRTMADTKARRYYFESVLTNAVF